MVIRIYKLINYRLDKYTKDNKIKILTAAIALSAIAILIGKLLSAFIGNFWGLFISCIAISPIFFRLSFQFLEQE